MRLYGQGSTDGGVMLGFIVQAVVTAIGLWASAKLVPGVEFTSTGSLVAAAIVLGLVNAFVRPLLVILTLPLPIGTFRLLPLVVNADMIGLTAMFLGGFVVDGLWAGIGAAIVTGVVSWIAVALFGGMADRA